MISPALAVALVVIVAGMVLVFDHLWLTTARYELDTAAAAAALAAAAELADDSRLLAEESTLPARNARHRADEVARWNRAAGNVIWLDPESPDDLRIGRVITDPDTGRERFLETDIAPNHVLVTAHCDREHGNPVSLFAPYITGRASADVRAFAAAAIDNRVVGVRPFANGTVPLWPIAILERDTGPEANGRSTSDEDSMQHDESWVARIDENHGMDRFGWDRTGGTVIEQEDGLPEIVLRGCNGSEPGNVCIVDLGTGLYDEPLRRQFEQGVQFRDLEEFGSELRLDHGPVSLSATDDFSGKVVDWLESQIGTSRIILLYREQPGSLREGGFRTVSVTRMAAARLMQVTRVDGGIEIVMQPSVLATRTALTAAELGVPLDETVPPNPYVYKLSLTR